MFVYIGVLLIALSFSVLVFFIIKLLNSVTGTVTSLDHSIQNLEKQMENVTDGSKGLVQQTGHLVDDVHHKLDAISGLIHTLQHVGSMLDTVNKTIDRSSNHFSAHTAKQSDRIAELAKWGNAAYQIYEEKGKRKK